MSRYLTTIQNNTTKQRTPDHPRYMGVEMQAHHILSKKGFQMSGARQALKSRGYDINHLKNLVFIPSTLQGACHLEVQPHRGDHTAEFKDDDKDEIHPTKYHEFISRRILRKIEEEHLENECKESEKVQRVMNALSAEILKLIQKGKVKLTNVAEHFDHDSKTGCAGLTSITDFKAANCPMGRNHHKDRPNQKPASEGIFFPKSRTPYILKPGE
jgi:hypothetical protein